MISHSSLFTFSICPNLYYEQYIKKTYVPPEKDCFLYGNVVDCLLTTPDDFEKKYIRVDRIVSPENALAFEQKIKDIEAELNAHDKKGKTMFEKAEEGNKVSIAGIEKRKTEISSLHHKIETIKELQFKTQVTTAVWNNCLDTVEVIKQNPFFKALRPSDSFNSQQKIIDKKNNRVGILDYLDFPNIVIRKLYASYCANLIDDAALRDGIAAIPDNKKAGIIVDIKTTRGITQFEPEIYSAQLAAYQQLVLELTGIRCRCFVVAGDKDPTRKFAQDYEFTQSLLDRAWSKRCKIEKLFIKCTEKKEWPSAKKLRGVEQKCFRCTECSTRPFSMNDEPVLVNGPILK